MKKEKPNLDPRAWRKVKFPEEQWDNFPLGTFARSHNGGWWQKEQGGWRAAGGDVFPRPGADAMEVQEPEAAPVTPYENDRRGTP